MSQWNDTVLADDEWDTVLEDPVGLHIKLFYDILFNFKYQCIYVSQINCANCMYTGG